MSDDTDYADILNRSWDEIPAPKLLPVGPWLVRGQNAVYKPGTDTASAKVLFFYTAQEPSDEVDEDALAELGAEYDFTINEIVHTIWIGRPKDWNQVRNHLALHGIDEPEMSIADSLKAFKGTQVIAHLDQRTYENRSQQMVTENNATSFQKLDD